jgi:hypothetical protein
MLAHQSSDSHTIPNLPAAGAAAASRRHSSHSASSAASSPLIGQRAPMQSSYLGQISHTNSGQGFESSSATIAPDDISLDTRPLLAGAPIPMPPDSRSQNGASAGQPANQTPESRSGASGAARDGGNGANPHETMFLGRANKVFVRVDRKIPPTRVDSFHPTSLNHFIQPRFFPCVSQVRLNVGGKLFATTFGTLSADRDSMFAAMLSGRYPVELDEQGAIFIDRYANESERSKDRNRNA